MISTLSYYYKPDRSLSFNEEVPFRPDHWCYGEEKSMIDEQFASAEKTTTEANQLKGQYEDALKSAKEESFSIVEQAKDEAKVQADSIVKRANDQAGQILEKARRDISTEQEAAMKAMEGKVLSWQWMQHPESWEKRTTKHRICPYMTSF